MDGYVCELFCSSPFDETELGWDIQTKDSNKDGYNGGGGNPCYFDSSPQETHFLFQLILNQTGSSKSVIDLAWPFRVGTL